MSWSVHTRVVHKNSNGEAKIVLDGYSITLKAACERGLGLNEDYCVSSCGNMPEEVKTLFFGEQKDEDGDSYSCNNWRFYTKGSLESAHKDLWGKMKELILREGRVEAFQKTQKYLILKNAEKRRVQEELTDAREELSDIRAAYDAITSLRGIFGIYDDYDENRTWIGISCE